MQYCATTGALINDHSSIRWHLLMLGKSTLRTGNDGIQFDFHVYSSPLSALSNTDVINIRPKSGRNSSPLADDNRPEEHGAGSALTFGQMSLRVPVSFPARCNILLSKPSAIR
jgi:hypothetical protein